MEAIKPRLTLREARHKRELTQEALAALADLDQEHISAIERGVVTQPKPATMKALSRALGMECSFGSAGLIFEEPNS